MWRLKLIPLALVACLTQGFLLVNQRKSPQPTMLRSEADSGLEEKTHLIFPGGGIFFYWQAGLITYLTEKNYDLSRTSSCGASAGALTATLAANGVDFYRATELALGLAADAGVWDRAEGLAGIWGPMIESWLDGLLPENAAANSKARELSLLVTPFPAVTRTERIRDFSTKEDLIACNMASVHLPLFLNGKFTSDFRNSRFLDGSFFSDAKYYLGENATNTLVLDHKRDPKYKDKTLLNAVEALSPEGIYQLIEDGKNYGQYLENQGELESLRSSATPRTRQEA